MWIGEREGEATPTVPESSRHSSSTAEDHSPDINDPPLLQSVLEELWEHHVSQSEIRVNIQRKHIWADYKEARKKYSIAPRDNIRVVFLGELDVDDAGPRREFFQVTST